MVFPIFGKPAPAPPGVIPIIGAVGPVAMAGIAASFGAGIFIGKNWDKIVDHAQLIRELGAVYWEKKWAAPGRMVLNAPYEGPLAESDEDDSLNSEQLSNGLYNDDLFNDDLYNDDERLPPYAPSTSKSRKFDDSIYSPSAHTTIRADPEAEHGELHNRSEGSRPLIIFDEGSTISDSSDCDVEGEEEEEEAAASDRSSVADAEVLSMADTASGAELEYSSYEELDLEASTYFDKQ